MRRDDLSSRNPAESAQLRVALIGRPRLVARDHGDIALPEKAYLLLAMLAVAPEARLDRDIVRRLIWQAESAERRAGSLRQLLSRIDQRLGQDLPPLLVNDRNEIRLNLSAWNVDLIDLSTARPPLAPQFWPLLQGELLEGANLETHGAEEWLRFERDRLSERRVHLLRETLDDADALSDADLLFLGGRLLDIDPAEESAVRALMFAYGRKKETSAARKIYQQCVDRLRDDYGAEPEPATRAMAERLGVVSHARAIEPMIRPDFQPVEHTGEPRIVILPPQAVLNDGVLGRIGHTLLEELTIRLGQQRGFKIIAAHTSLELLSRAIDPAAAAPELTFDYSVYVTIRGGEEDVYATCRLTKLSDSSVLWAHDFSLGLAHINDSFAQLSRRIVLCLTDRIEREELLQPVDVSPTAYRLYLEGKRLLAKTELPLLRKARQFFQASLKRCDSFAPAHAGIARATSLEWVVRFMRDRDLLDKAKDAALQARETDPNNGRVFRELGHISLYQRRFEESLAYYQHAQELSPNDADILADHADALSHDGQLDRALELSLSAFRLNPLPSDHYYWQLGGIYYVQQNYAKALEALEPVRSKPATARLLAASYAMIGDLQQANRYAQIVLENFPDFRTEHLWHFVPDRDPGYTRLLIEGLNRAGLN